MQKSFKDHPQQKDFAPLFGPGDVPGLLTKGDIDVAIPTIVDILPVSGLFVEVGCFLGKSTVEWARNIQNKNKQYRVISIDSFNSPAQVIINLLLEAEFDIPDHCKTQLDYFRYYTRDYEFVYPVVGFFNENFCFPTQIDGVFEDSTHNLRYLTHALPFWWNHLRSGGVLSGHDYGGEVRTAVDIFAAVHGVKIQTFEKYDSSIWYIEKK